MLPILLLLLSLHPAEAGAGVSCGESTHIPNFFLQRANLTDENIRVWCRYSKDDNVNGKITAADQSPSGCVEDYEKIRGMARRYKKSLEDHCAELSLTQPNCAGSSNESQASCMESAGKLSNSAAQRQQDLARQLAEGKALLQKISTDRTNRAKALGQNQRAINDAIISQSPAQQKRVRASSSFRPGNTTYSNSTKPTFTNGKDSTPAEVPSAVDKAPPGATTRTSQLTGVKGSPEGGGGNIPNTNPSTRTIYASEGGVRTIGEYQQRLPFLIQENERLIKEARTLESSFKKAEVKHEKAAVELGTQALKIFTAAKSLGSGEKSETAKALELSSLRPTPAQKVIAPAVQTEGEIAATEANVEPELTNFAPLEAAIPVAPAEEAPVVQASGELSNQEASVARNNENDELLQESFREEIPATPEQNSLRVASLKDSLRKKLAAKNNEDAAGEKDLPSPAKPLVAEILREQRNISSANPNPAQAQARQPAPSVEEAMADMESQVNDLLRSVGILGSDTEDLFRRVRSAHARSLKNGLVTP